MLESTATSSERPVPGSPRRLLIAGGVIVALLLLAVATLTILGGQQPKLLTDATPGGVVQRFLIAIDAGDYPGAFQYLSPTITTSQGPRDRSYTEFRDQFGFASRDRSRSMQVVLDSETVEGDQAHVVVYVSYAETSGPPFLGSSVHGHRDTFTLNRVSGEWRIVNYPYDVYSW